MNILLSNDDGIHAEGIRRLAAALSARGKVYVVAPDRQRSASSHALSVSDELVMTQVLDFPGAEKAWALSGTPADCVKVGLDILQREGIDLDMVYAGINHGANLSTDALYSGTISAAAEGLFAGYPAVAVSVCSHQPAYFDGACRLALAVFDGALEEKGRGRLISVNVPNIPAEEIRGIRPARLGTLVYDEWFEELPGEGHEPGSQVFRYTGTPQEEEREADIDIRLIGEGYGTVSMIKYDLNDYKGLEKLKEWEIKL